MEEKQISNNQEDDVIEHKKKVSFDMNRDHSNPPTKSVASNQQSDIDQLID